jgi:hypothetical protein
MDEYSQIFNQYHGMAKGVLPISGNSLLAQRHNARAQIRGVTVGKEQETTVVGRFARAMMLSGQVVDGYAFEY